MVLLIPVAFVLDLAVGDPRWIRFHPVRLMGYVIEKLHPAVDSIALRSAKENQGSGEDVVFPAGEIAERRDRWRESMILAGALYPGVLIIFTVLFFLLIRQLPPPVFSVIYVYVLYSSLATHSLAKEVLGVSALRDPAQKRKALSMLCSRDTDALDERGINSTLFETTAENSVDGVLAPLFYMLLFAPFGMSGEAALIYKCISTCDSMVGYKNDRFLYTGRISARLDDILNYVPARVSVVFILLSGALVDFFYSIFFTNDGRYGKEGSLLRGIRIYLRDRTKHESPNSAHPMSAFAGVFGVRIGGPMPYFGKLKEKPFIGDEVYPLSSLRIRLAVTGMVLSSLMMLATGLFLISL